MKKEEVKAKYKLLDDALVYFRDVSKFESNSTEEPDNFMSIPDLVRIRVVEKLEVDGMLKRVVSEKGSDIVYLTFDGAFFLENTPRIIYRNKPYKYSQAIKRYKRITSAAKSIIIIIIIIN